MTNPKEPDNLWTFISDHPEKYQLSLASEVPDHVSKPALAKMLIIAIAYYSNHVDIFVCLFIYLFFSLTYSFWFSQVEVLTFKCA